MRISEALHAKRLGLPLYDLPDEITDEKIKRKATDYLKVTANVFLEDVVIKRFQNTTSYLIWFETYDQLYMDRLKLAQDKNKELIEMLNERDTKIVELETKLRETTAIVHVAIPNSNAATNLTLQQITKPNKDEKRRTTKRSK